MGEYFMACNVCKYEAVSENDSTYCEDCEDESYICSDCDKGKIVCFYCHKFSRNELLAKINEHKKEIAKLRKQLKMVGFK